MQIEQESKFTLKAMLRIRMLLFPTVIISMLVLVYSKAGRIWENLQNGIVVSDAQATQEVKQSSKPEAAKEPDKVHDNSFEQQSSSEEEFDILKLTPEKVQVLKMLANRRQEIAQQEKVLQERESVLAAIEKRLDEKSTKLKELEGNLKTLVEQKDEKDSEAAKKLAIMYAKMKPDTAANILQGLDLETLLSIMEQMKDAQASLILANMTPEKARYLTMVIAKRRSEKEQQLAAANADAQAQLSNPVDEKSQPKA